ncbi:MAG: ATP-binding protein [Bacteroidales bacterium]|nr:ATP-binding protein [Bacteroidales bacterium]
MIITNLPFTRWEEIIKDKVLCSALVDRLCHKVFMVNMTGQSYRVKETQNIFKKLRKQRDLLTFETTFRWPLFQIHFGGNPLYYLQIGTVAQIIRLPRYRN